MWAVSVGSKETDVPFVIAVPCFYVQCSAWFLTGGIFKREAKSESLMQRLGWPSVFPPLP